LLASEAEVIEATIPQEPAMDSKHPVKAPVGLH
jgi:hypothetical protein